jgi:hypothetical protein
VCPTVVKRWSLDKPSCSCSSSGGPERTTEDFLNLCHSF